MYQPNFTFFLSICCLSAAI